MFRTLEKEKYLFPCPFKFSTGNLLTQDRLTREEQTHLFNEDFCDTEAFMREWKPRDMVDLSELMLGLRKSKKLCKDRAEMS